MEVVLSVCPTPESILCRMQTIDKKKEPVIYLSLDCALCYIVYKSCKDVPEMSVETDKVTERIVANIKKMQESAAEM
jgi:hypothetical protein